MLGSLDSISVTDSCNNTIEDNTTLEIKQHLCHVTAFWSRKIQKQESEKYQFDGRDSSRAGLYGLWGCPVGWSK